MKLDYAGRAPDDRTMNRPPRLSTYNKVCIALAIVAFIAAAGMLILPQFGRSRPIANVIKCGSNLKQIGLAIHLYAADHGDALPPDFATLMGPGELQPQTFICASNDCTDDVAKLPSAATTQQAAGTVVEGTSTCWYFLCKFPGQTLSQLTPRHVLVYEKPLNHTTETNGMNVLFADGHTDWIPAPLRDKIAAELAAGQNPPPSLP